MKRLGALARSAHSNEQGHAVPAVASLIGAIGAILLGIGAANDSGGLAIAGGVLAGVGFLAGAVLEHMNVDYDVFRRLENLEKK